MRDSRHDSVGADTESLRPKWHNVLLPVFRVDSCAAAHFVEFTEAGLNTTRDVVD